MIASGRVTINDEPISSPARNVGAEDIITLDGNILTAIEPARIFLFYKPRAVLTANSDKHGRSCLPDFLPPTLSRLKAVGRLDFHSEGLLLLTTDGDLSRYLEHPDNALLRRYRLRLQGDCDERARALLKGLAQGITIEGFRYRPITIKIRRADNCAGNFWIEAMLHEGKNRELRKIMNYFGYGVSRLIRTQYGSFTLGRLEEGEIAEVSDEMLKRTLPRRFLAKTKISKQVQTNRNRQTKIGK